MKILIITPRIPYPPFRGDKLKIYNIAKILARNNAVSILTFYKNNKQLKDIRKFNELGIHIETVTLSVIETSFWLFSSLFTKLPFQLALFRSYKMKKRVEKIVSDGKYDIVYYHWVRIAQYFSANNNTIKVIDYTDAVSLNLSRRILIERNPLSRFFIKIEQKRIANYEKIAEKFHTLFICSEFDKKFLENNGIKANYKLLYNGIDTNYFTPIETKMDENRIIFTGNMPYYANTFAVQYFVKNIFPLILKKKPESKFYVVGQKPPRKVLELESKKVIVTGFVSNIKNEYLKSAVNVAPMRFGAGTLNKVLESIALGVPVVATSIAVMGLPNELSKYIFVADSDEEFANKVVKIMNDSSIRNELMKEAQVVAKSLFSWEKIVNDFEKYLLSITS